MRFVSLAHTDEVIDNTIRAARARARFFIRNLFFENWFLKRF